MYIIPYNIYINDRFCSLVSRNRIFGHSFRILWFHGISQEIYFLNFQSMAY